MDHQTDIENTAEDIPTPEDEIDAGKNNQDKNTAERQSERLTQLPLSRIKAIMKLDPDLSLASSEAVFLVTRATELFIQSLARESYVHTMQSKKKTIQKRDVDLAISTVDSLVFLEGWNL